MIFEACIRIFLPAEIRGRGTYAHGAVSSTKPSRGCFNIAYDGPFVGVSSAPLALASNLIFTLILVLFFFTFFQGCVMLAKQSQNVPKGGSRTLGLFIMESICAYSWLGDCLSLTGVKVRSLRGLIFLSGARKRFVVFSYSLCFNFVHRDFCLLWSVCGWFEKRGLLCGRGLFCVRVRTLRCTCVIRVWRLYFSLTKFFGLQRHDKMRNAQTKILLLR